MNYFPRWGRVRQIEKWFWNWSRSSKQSTNVWKWKFTQVDVMVVAKNQLPLFGVLFKISVFDSFFREESP